MASSPATQVNLHSLPSWKKDFVPRVGRVLLRRALKLGWRSARLATIPLTGLLNSFADLGDKDQAFRWLNIAYQERDRLLAGMRTDFLLYSISSDPRFAELERKVGLPQ